MQVRIKFLVSGANSLVGGYCAGDTARVSAAFGKHLVEEVGCAQYADATPAAEPAPEPAPAPAPAAKRGKK
jgi:hypothetical protein